MKASDFALIRRTLEGDQSAFTTLVKKYEKWVHALVWRKIGDFHIAEELTQDVFLKVYKKLSTLKPTDHFPGWLYVIASRHCITWFRKKHLSITSLDAMSASEIEEFCYTQYESKRDEKSALERQREIIKRLLQKLPESERTVVTLHYLAEMSCEKISEYLGVSPNTIKSRLNRARKRLEKQEHLLQDASSLFRVPPTLAENIAREISQIKPDSPSVGKPWLPWGISFATTLLVVLLIAPGTLMLSRFQQPYSFEATSEMTVELIDVSVLKESKRKPDARTQFGRADIQGENSSTTLDAESPFIATVQADGQDNRKTEPQWIQTKGFGDAARTGLFLTSDRTLYAIAKTGLYRLSEKADAWTFVNSRSPNREFEPVMTEHEGTLYLLTSDELLTSTDGGKTLDVIGTRPKGHPVALVITDKPQTYRSDDAETTIFLALKTEIFRSNDTGKVWESIGEVLQSERTMDLGSPSFRIWDALVIDNALFVGTSHGLFRFTDTWEKLTVPTSQGINSLAVAEGRLYVGTITYPVVVLNQNPAPEIFYSTDFGDSWTDITPNIHKFPTKVMTAIQLVPFEKILMVIGPGGMLFSYNGGEVWTDLGDGPNMSALGVSPVVALDKDNFYKSDVSGVTRSTDSGITWQPFTIGLVNPHIPNLFTIKNALYALTPTETLKSIDGGESWESVGLRTNGNAPLKGAKIAISDGVLYASVSEFDKVTLFRLSDAGDMFLTIEGVPNFKRGPLQTEGPNWHRDAWTNGNDVVIAQGHWKADEHRVVKEWKANRTFAFSEDTLFMEYRHKLFRWQRGETAWHDTGLENSGSLSGPDDANRGLTLAVSGETVYVGKRDGSLFQSVDNGDTWRNITPNLAFSFGYFKEMLFAGSTVYVSTDKGVMCSRDGEMWHALTDADGNRCVIDRIAVDGITVYTVCDSGVYRIETNTLEQIAPKLPHTATAFAVDSNTFYIGTRQNGVLRFQRENR